MHACRIKERSGLDGERGSPDALTTASDVGRVESPREIVLFRGSRVVDGEFPSELSEESWRSDSRVGTRQ